MKDFLIIFRLLYTYLLPTLFFIGIYMYSLKFKNKYLILSLTEIILIVGVIVITYMEAIYVDNNGLSGGQNNWIYFVISTFIYIIMILQIYLVRKNRT